MIFASHTRLVATHILAKTIVLAGEPMIIPTMCSGICFQNVRCLIFCIWIRTLKTTNKTKEYSSALIKKKKKNPFLTIVLPSSMNTLVGREGGGGEGCGGGGVKGRTTYLQIVPLVVFAVVGFSLKRY